MSTLRARQIEHATGTNLTLGASGDTVSLYSDSLQTNLFADAGGNTIIQSDGAGTLSNVNKSLKHGPILISETIIEFGNPVPGMDSVSFTSGIDSTYDEYLFVFVAVRPTQDGNNFTFQMSIDGGTNYNRNITSQCWTITRGESAAGYMQYQDSLDLQDSTSYQPIGMYVGSDTNECVAGFLHLFNPASTTFQKHFIAEMSSYSSSVYTRNDFVTGYANTTSAVNAIDFKFASGAITEGKIKMYGIG